MGAHGMQLGFSTQVDEGCELERNFTFGGSTQQVSRGGSSSGGEHLGRTDAMIIQVRRQLPTIVIQM